MWYKVIYILGDTAEIISQWVGLAYVKLWGAGQLGISWFDHRFDSLRGAGNWYWCERGVIGVQAIREGDKVLDIGSGDGIYSGLFYSTKASKVDAMDKDSKAVEYATRKYGSKKCKFSQRDAVTDEFPGTSYDTICMFEVIEHFSDENGTEVLAKIVKALKPTTGQLIGSTPILPKRGGYNFEHDNEFLSTAQLERFLKPHFKSVKVWTSKWADRTAGYFHCEGPVSSNKKQRLDFLKQYRSKLGK